MLIAAWMLVLSVHRWATISRCHVSSGRAVGAIAVATGARQGDAVREWEIQTRLIRNVWSSSYIC